LSSSDVLYGIVAGSPSAFNILGQVEPSNGSTFIAQLDIEDIPSQGRALFALDALVFSDVDTGPLTSAQKKTLENWLIQGGKMIVTGGAGWQKTAAGLEDLLPLVPNNSTTLQSLSALQSYSPEEELDPGPVVVATGNTVSDANVLVTQNNLPILITKNIGYGKSLYIAPDPGLDPLRRWDGIEYVYYDYLSTSTDHPKWIHGFHNWDSANDAAGTYPDLGLPSTFFICGFLAIYVLAVGPLNYLAVRTLKKRELSWVSIPLLVLSFTCIAFLLGGAIRGNRPQLNRLAIVQVIPGTEFSQVDGLVGVFSPNRATYDLIIADDFLAHSIPVSYGISSGNWNLFHEGTNTLVPELRIEAGGVRALSVQGTIPTPSFASDIKLIISRNNVVIEGTIENTSGFDLEGAAIMYPGGYELLGDFEQGETRHIRTSLSKASQAGFINGQPTFGYSVSSYLYNYYEDTTLDALTSNVYYYQNSEAYQKYSLANAAIHSEGGAGSRGSGIFLSGWTKSPIIPASLDRDFRAQDNNLFLVSLEPVIDNSTSPQKYPPPLFTWQVLDAGSSSYRTVAPYNMYLSGDDYVIRFTLNQNLQYEEASGLIFHLKGSGTHNTQNVGFYLWDFSLELWAPLSINNWGDINIPDPSRFVGKNGDIRLRVEELAYSGVTIERSDFTLIVSE
jgi:hypothetical protein